MPWTNFPNGVSVTTATGTVAGQVNATTVAVPSGGYTGETAVLAFSCGSASGASVSYQPVPFAGNVVSAAVVQGATVTVTTLHTLRIGSAGTSITTVTNASGTIGKVTVATIATPVAVTTANSLSVARAVSGTAGDTWVMCTISRTS